MWIRRYLFVFVGLLTVDPKLRLTTSDVLEHPWLNQRLKLVVSQRNPLMTPEVLGSRRKRSIEHAVTVTLNAFHKAVKEGFVLRDVAHAPLAKRRKRKKDSSTSTEEGLATFLAEGNKPLETGLHLPLFDSKLASNVQ